jgi:hypothetical protein
MNKIVHLKFGNDLIESFEETRIALRDPNVMYQKYREIVKVHFDHNFGILYTKWQYIFMVAAITDESKFAMFMLKYPEYIEKIVYE